MLIIGAFNAKFDPIIGGLFFFKYDAKYKDVLPYWDRFPLLIPFTIESNRFFGFNVHYLGKRAREKLIKGLLTIKRH